MGLGVGTRIGPYEITAPLGKGGIGVVLRARDTRLQRDVALKLLPEHLAPDTDRLKRFEREAQLLVESLLIIDSRLVIETALCRPSRTRTDTCVRWLPLAT